MAHDPLTYYLHPDGRIAACETDETAERAEARGFRRVSRRAYLRAWARREFENPCCPRCREPYCVVDLAVGVSFPCGCGTLLVVTPAGGLELGRVR